MAAKLVVSLALLFLLFSRVDARELWADARRASLSWIVAALVVYGLNVAASSWRWHLLLRAQQVRIPGRTLLGSLLYTGFNFRRNDF